MVALLLTILAAIGVALVIRNPLQAHSFPFYAVALVADALTLWGGPVLGLATDGNPLWAAFYGLMRRGIPAFALFTVVMFVGCFKNGSRPKRWLAPVRAELSILACVLSVPHIVFYLQTYNRIMFGGIVQPTQITYDAYWFSVLLTAVLGVLGVLSFKLIRNRMPRRLWKGIQRLAYPFFVMVYVHVVLVRLRPNPDALDTVLQSTAVYGLFVVVYLVARVARWVLDRRAWASRPQERPRVADSLGMCARGALENQ